MRIAFITFEYPPLIIGGAGIYALNLTHELAKLGHQIVVFTPEVLEKQTESDLCNLKIQKVPVNKKLPFKALQFWLHLPSEVKNLENTAPFDILHFNGISYWFLKKKLSKAIHIVTVHHLVKDAIKNNNLNFISRLKDFSGENSLFMSFLENQCIKSSDKLIAVSNFTKRRIVDYYDLDLSKIEVIYNGTSLNFYSFGKSELNNLKSQLNIKDGPVLLFVGRVDDPRKGLPFLLKSLSLVLKQIDVTLLVVGQGDQSKLKEIVKSLNISNNVIFTGYVDDLFLKMCYSLCDIYVCPSRLEGFGLTILDAMIAGKPIVATDVGAIPELIMQGVNGILIDPNNPDQFAESLVYLLQNNELSSKIGFNNREQVSKLYDWEKAAKLVEEIYMRSR